MTDLARGFTDAARGLEFLRKHSSLWKWIVAPAVITLVLVIAAILGVASLTTPVVAWLTAHLPSWLEGIASWILTIVVFLGLGLAALLLFVSVAGMIAGPFNELLSEAVEERLTGRPGPPFSFGAFMHGAVLGTMHALRRLLTTLFGVVLLFVLGFIPVVGTFAAIIVGGWYASRGAAYDAYDAVLSRRELAYKDKLTFLDRYRGRSLGLGVAVAGMLLVPGLNLVALGIGAVGATLAIHDLEAATRSTSST
ncbi:MAG: putative integral rane protein [Myxococcales bacterium]|nr:putative integral rane protein [Myxococcales bacterium]